MLFLFLNEYFKEIGDTFLLENEFGIINYTMNNIDLKHKMRFIEPSATLVINELSSKLVTEGKEIYRLGFGQSPFPVPNALVKALKKYAHKKEYLPVKGLMTLRQAVADFFRRKYHLSTKIDDIIVGPGSKELIFDLQMVVKIDELLLPSPSWVSYEPQAKLTDHKVCWISTSEKANWKISPKDIVKHCDKEPKIKRTIILNYPSNPLGVTYSDKELKELAMVFKKYEILVIADEIYGEIHHNGKHQTIAKYYPEGTIISTGLSKWAGAGGWRLGVFIFPQNLRNILNAMAVVASETYTSTTTPIQYAAIEAYKENEVTEVYIKNCRKILKIVGLYVCNTLKEIGVTMPEPEGGFYVFPNFNKWKLALIQKGIYTSTDFCNRILNEVGVALLPGEAFGTDKENFTVRLSYVDFDGERLLNVLKDNPNIKMDKEFVKKYCPRIVIAIKKIEEWILSI